MRGRRSHDGDLATIRQPLDFYGVNYYNPLRVAARADRGRRRCPFEFRRAASATRRTDFGWPVVPDALREWLVMLRARYRAALPPIMITETGCAYDTGPTRTAWSTTRPRIDYLDAHLRRRRRPRSGAGVDVRGYYTLVAAGQLRVGRGLHPALRPRARRLRDPRRTPKRSFDWYAEMIAAQGADSQKTG